MQLYLLLLFLPLLSKMSCSQNNNTPNSSQSIPQTLLGSWKIISYKDLKSGEFLEKSPESDKNIIVVFGEDQTFTVNACNNVIAEYLVTSEKLVTLQNFKPRTKMACMGWEGKIENALGFQKQLQYQFDAEGLKISADGEFKIDMERVSF